MENKRVLFEAGKAESGNSPFGWLAQRSVETRFFVFLYSTF